jgi:hypothetical protein
MRLSSLSEEDSLLNPHPLLQEPEKLGMKREADQGAEGESGGMVVEDVDTPETPDLSLIPEVHAIDKQDRTQLGLKTRQVETIDQQAGPVLATEPDEQLEPWWIALHAYAGKPWPVGRQARPQPRLDEVRLDVSIHAWLTTVLQISKLEGWLPSAQPWRLLKPQDCSVQSAVAQSGIIVSLQDANPGHLQAAQEQILWGLVRVNDEHWALELASLGGERSIKLPHSADPFAWLKHQVQVMLNKPLALWRWAQR